MIEKNQASYRLVLLLLIEFADSSAAMLAERVAKAGKSARYVGDFEAIRNHLEEHCQSGDLLMTVGAGDVFKIGEAFLKE